MTRIKVSCMGLDQSYFPRGIVKTVSALLCNFFYHIDENILMGISTWASEGIL